jgi:tetratricopeptide (TPR) repeat protein
MLFKVKKLRLNPTAALAIIVIVTALTFANSLFGDFISDDWPQIANNEKITKLEYVPYYFTRGVWANTEIELEDTFLYRPFFLFTLFFNHQIWGDNPFGYHLTSLLVHIMNTILVFLLLRRLLITGGLIPPLAGALIFAVHPVHVEAVSWISSLPDLLASLFILSSLTFYIKYTEDGKTHFIVLALVLFFLSLFSKEIAIVFPFVAASYSYIREKKINIFAVGTLLLTVVLYFFIRSWALEGTLGKLEFTFEGIKIMFDFIAGYIRLLLFPWPLKYYFEIPESGISGTGVLILASITLVISLILAVRKKGIPLFAMLWILITLLPALSLAFNPIPAFAERYLYLPSVGFTFLITVIVARLLSHNNRAVIPLIGILIVMGAVSIRGNLDWKNDEVFYSKVIRTTPQFKGGYTGLAHYYEKTGQMEEAIGAYKKVLSLVSGKEKAAFCENIATIYGKELNDTEKSFYYYQKALESDPNSSSALVGIGNNYWRKKDYRKALYYYSTAFSLDSSNYEACYNLGFLYDFLGEKDKALYYYEIFVNTAPRDEYGSIMDKVINIIKNY